MKYDRIESLRLDHDYKIKEIAEALELNRDVYSRYEKGLREIPVSSLLRLARYYDVSVDYILGVIDEKRPYGQ